LLENPAIFRLFFNFFSRRAPHDTASQQSGDSIATPGSASIVAAGPEAKLDRDGSMGVATDCVNCEMLPVENSTTGRLTP
jgi:hypothetical protein